MQNTTVMTPKRSEFKLNQSTFSMLQLYPNVFITEWPVVTHWGFKIYDQVLDLKSNCFINSGPYIRVTHRIPYIRRHCRLYWRFLVSYNNVWLQDNIRDFKIIIRDFKITMCDFKILTVTGKSWKSGINLETKKLFFLCKIWWNLIIFVETKAPDDGV